MNNEWFINIKRKFTYIRNPQSNTNGQQLLGIIGREYKKELEECISPNTFNVAQGDSNLKTTKAFNVPKQKKLYKYL